MMRTYQLDMEMAFAGQDEVFSVIEDVLPPIFAKYGTYSVASEAPFRRISYVDAMETYGTDKPDLRIDLTVQDMTDLVDGIGICSLLSGLFTVRVVIIIAQRRSRGKHGKWGNFSVVFWRRATSCGRGTGHPQGNALLQTPCRMLYCT